MPEFLVLVAAAPGKVQVGRLGGEGASESVLSLVLAALDLLPHAKVDGGSNRAAEFGSARMIRESLKLGFNFSNEDLTCPLEVLSLLPFEAWRWRRRPCRRRRRSRGWAGSP